MSTTKPLEPVTEPRKRSGGAHTATARHKALRARGRPVGVVLLDTEAIAALDALTATGLSVRAAIEQALKSNR